MNLFKRLKPIRAIINVMYRIKRAWDYAKFGYSNYDYDSAYLYDLMAFKLKRIHSYLTTGCAVQEKENMDALLEAIRITDRLYAEGYDFSYLHIHDKKWGKLQMSFEDIEGSTNKRCKLFRSKAITEEEKEQELEERRIIYHNAENDRLKDLDRLNKIFKINLRTWWD